MQIVVLSMHRSGSSVTARLLNMMGAYFAPEGMALGITPNNPKGFWERRDVVDLNDRLLRSTGMEWDRALSFELRMVPSEVASSCEKEARQIITSLDSFRPWMIKDPRLCLTFGFWRPLLEMPVCVFCVRRPLEVARSLLKRNHMPIPVGLALWEYYTVRAIEFSQGLPRIVVQHHEMVRDTMNVLDRLRGELEKHAVSGLRCPTKAEVTSYLEPSLIHHRVDTAEQEVYLTSNQKHIYALLEKGGALDACNVSLSEQALGILRFYEDYLTLQSAHKYLKTDAVGLSAKKRELAELLKVREVRFQQLREQLNASDVKYRELEKEYKISARHDKEHLAKAADAERRAHELGGRLAEAQRINRSLQRDISRKDVEISRLGQVLKAERCQVGFLRRVVEQLFAVFEVLFASRRWRLGDRVLGCAEGLGIGEKSESALREQVSCLHHEYRGWLEAAKTPPEPAIPADDSAEKHPEDTPSASLASR